MSAISREHLPRDRDLLPTGVVSQFVAAVTGSAAAQSPPVNMAGPDPGSGYGTYVHAFDRAQPG